MDNNGIPDDEAGCEECEHSPLTYQIDETKKVTDSREKMESRGMYNKGPKRTLSKRTAYLSYQQSVH